MGIFNEVLSAVEGGGASHASLATHVLEMLNPSTAAGPGGPASLGGLSGLVEKMTASGLGDVVQSWIATGVNLPISADQIKAVLGSDVMNHLAGKVGMHVDSIAPLLAQILPGLVDNMTPDGQIAPPAGT